MARSSARRGIGWEKARGKRDACKAVVELRWRAVELPPPETSGFRNEAPIHLNLMHVHEPEPPDGDKPLEWFLLTNLPFASDRDAERILKWYRLRWRIKDWHRVLKSGCKVEYLVYRTGDRIEWAVTINAVIAWRQTAMTMMGRETPELPADILFSAAEPDHDGPVLFITNQMNSAIWSARLSSILSSVTLRTTDKSPPFMFSISLMRVRPDLQRAERSVPSAYSAFESIRRRRAAENLR